MTASSESQASAGLRGWSERLFGCLPYTSLLGVVSLVANMVLSFEEPHSGLLLAAAVLVGSAPAGLLLHLSATSTLTRGEKRKWVTGLASRRGPALFAAYFRPSERARVTRTLVSMVDDDPKAGSGDKGAAVPNSSA